MTVFYNGSKRMNGHLFSPAQDAESRMNDEYLQSSNPIESRSPPALARMKNPDLTT